MSEYILVAGELYHADELMHYGVLGMKWGHRKAQRNIVKNEKLNKKALKYDIKSAKFTKKSEKKHAKWDLGRSNRAAIKSAKLQQKSAKLKRKALKVDEGKRIKLEKKAGKLDYKAAKKTIKGNRLSKTTGYGMVAMRYSVKSDKVAAKAAKARMKMAKNQAYIDMFNRKVNSLSNEELNGAYAFLNGSEKKAG